ncbi:MAG: hypothetical protein E3J72_19795 [Planctomycetota bacterium]|nr:MAG: hypothetical protein E3J72_19795 [Planctomycetota bacterium]
MKPGETGKTVADTKWQIGRLSVTGGAISFGLAFLIMVLLGKAMKKNPKTRFAPVIFLAMVAFGVLGAVLVLGGLVLLALGIGGRQKTGLSPIDMKSTAACRAGVAESGK